MKLKAVTGQSRLETWLTTGIHIPLGSEGQGIYKVPIDLEKHSMKTFPWPFLDSHLAELVAKC